MKMSEYIRSCDDDFRTRLYGIADALSAGTADGVRLISLSGPTCSGKTTAAAMLAERIGAGGRRVNIVSIDDFYYDRSYLYELSRQNGTDKLDYDSAATIDTSELARFISAAFTRDRVSCPVFDFKTGTRSGLREIETSAEDTFIFEGIQAIYPQITELFRPYGFAGIYIAPMTSIVLGGQTYEPDELRLLRRLVRDRNFRNSTAEFTMQLWEGVRQNEEKNIFPYVGECAVRIDSTMKYEIGVLKPYLEELLSQVADESPYYVRARAILEKISSVEPIDSSLIDDRSLYREFV